VTLFRRMFVEEFRLHTELFGRRRFFAFPLFTTLLAAVGAWLLQLTETSTATIIGGIFVLVAFLGLQVGTIGLVARDAMENVLGDFTLLVFSARTLPISRRRLLATFLAKDFVFYVFFFCSPVVLGLAPFALAAGLSPGKIALLWVTVAATFALAAGGSLVLAGIATRSKLALVTVVAGITVLILTVPSQFLAWTPYAVYADPAVRSLVGFVPVVAVLVAGPVLFEPPSSGSVRRITNDRYQRLQALGDSLTVRPLLELSRSSGSVWKVAFSLGVLFGVTALLLDRLVVATGLEPSAGLAFGTLLGIGTFTTYNWLTQFDEPREYLRYPVELEAVFAGKRRAFLVCSMPAGLAYLGLAAIWYPLTDLLLGVVVFPLVSVYIFGLTAYLAGLSPNQLLFDTPLFAAYGVAIAVVAVPMLVAAMAYGTAPQAASGAAIAIAVVAALAGIVLARRTGRRWHERLWTS